MKFKFALLLSLIAGGMIVIPKLDTRETKTIEYEEESSAHVKKSKKKKKNARKKKSKRRRSKRARAREREEESSEKKKKIVFIIVLASFVLYGAMNPSSVDAPETSPEEESSPDQEILGERYRPPRIKQVHKEALNKTLTKLKSIVRGELKMQGKNWKGWLCDEDESVTNYVEKRIFSYSGFDITKRHNLYRFGKQLLEKRRESSPLEIAYLLSHAMHLYLRTKSREDLAQEISGDPRYNLLALALTYHESGYAPMDEPPPEIVELSISESMWRQQIGYPKDLPPERGQVNMFPIIYVCLYYNNTADGALGASYFGKTTIKELAESKGLELDTDTYTYDRRNKVGMKIIDKGYHALRPRNKMLLEIQKKKKKD